MQMAAGLDTGDMLLKVRCPIGPTDGGQSIHDRLSEDGANALLTTLGLLGTDKLCAEAQDETLACYAHKLSKAEAEINWSDSAVAIDRQIRAFDAWPTAFSYLNDKPIRFFSSTLSAYANNVTPSSIAPGTVIAESNSGIDVLAGDGSVVRITSLQMAGGKRMQVTDFLNARSLAGACFTSTDRTRGT